MIISIMGDDPALMVRKMGPATLLTPQPTFQPAKMVKPAVDRMPRYVERLCALVHTWAGELFRPIRGTRTFKSALVWTGEFPQWPEGAHRSRAIFTGRRQQK